MRWRILHGPAYPRHAGTLDAPQRPLLIQNSAATVMNTCRGALAWIA